MRRSALLPLLLMALALPAPEGEGWAAAMVQARPVGGPAAVCRGFDSGPLRGDGPGVAVSVPVAGQKILRLTGRCVEGTANCHIWGDPRLIAKDGTVTSLTALKPVAVHVGWGELLTDRNWQGHPLRIAGTAFAHGLWLHADSELRYTLDGRYERFEATVGVDQDRATGIARFQVLGDEDSLLLPASWREVCRRFPAACGWLERDLGRDGVAEWFANRVDAACERSLLGKALGALPADPPVLRTTAAAAIAALASVPAGDGRWLEVYARLARSRAILTIVGWGGADAAITRELGGLLAADVPAGDRRWDELQQAAIHASEITSQYESLLHDLAQRNAINAHAAETVDAASLIDAADRDPLDVVLRRTAVLHADIAKRRSDALVTDAGRALEGLRSRAQAVAPADPAARRALFNEACALRRRIAFANPLLSFDRLLFIKRNRALFGHMCDQFYGLATMPGGGIYELREPFGVHPQERDLLADAVVAEGRLKGQHLSGGPLCRPALRYDGVGHLTGPAAEGGAFLSPALSYDGKDLIFAHVECSGDTDHRWHTDASRGHWAEGRCFHLFRIGVDGSGLRQLTDGTWNEFDPCWLPNGRVAFISERRGGYLRCGRVCPLYNLHDMAPDGSGINLLSFHDSNEWFPSVTNDGRMVYTRWDYVDRHGCAAHHPWITSLDGSDPRQLHGNFSIRNTRADLETHTRAIPESRNFVATATPHHGQSYGSLVLINPTIPDDDHMGPARRLTPEVAFPESQKGREVYATPWPLADGYHLCVYDDAMNRNDAHRPGGNYGIYLVDAFGNKELIHRDPDIGCLSPMPIRATTPPPVMPTASLAAAPANPKPVVEGDTGSGTMAVVNVYESLKPWPDGTKLTHLRILQMLPCSVPSGGGQHPHETGKRIAEAGDSIVPARWVLGTVPIETDGSAHFTVPANRSLFFQALDERGMAVQSMRSATYIRNGERLVCHGCHQPQGRAPAAGSSYPLAFKRGPSLPQPEAEGSNPFSYPLLVQPVLDRHCVACHAKEAPKMPLASEPIRNKWFASYNSLLPFAFTSYGDHYRTIPGHFGAKASKLLPLLDKGHHGVKLPPEDLRRLTLWLDCSSLFYGVYEKEPGEAQLKGGNGTPSLW